MPNQEITLKELCEDYDWGQVFADDTTVYNPIDKAEAAPPGSKVNTSKPNRKDIKKIIAAVNGDNDGPDWLGLFLLKDGRYLIASGGCDFTGWDCQSGNSMIVCANMKDALQYGLSEPERNRLGLIL